MVRSMKQRYVGRTGLKVGRLALGTLTWGTDVDEHEASAQLRAFVDAGGSLLDTASGYGRGASEAVVGTLLRGSAVRDDLVLATKGGITSSRGEWLEDTSRGAMLRTLDASLRRLGVDYVDLWQVNAASDEVPVEETLSAFDAAVTTGRARYVGICNYSGWRTAQAATYQRCAPGRVGLASAQVEYSLLQRGVEREVVPAALDLGLGILPWSPLGRGVLTGKYRGGVPADSRGASSTFANYVAEFLTPRAARIVEAVCRAAEGLDLSPMQVALAWVRDQPGVAAPIVGARTAAQLAASLASEQVELPAEIVDALDDVSAPEMGYPEA
jgi:aryl-alcohol dehydrogenase-like predicted oxidoreductase